MIDKSPQKAVVTVSEMAHMCNLSRARFYELMNKGVFPAPVYLVTNHRPVYDAELQEVCLDVRRRGVGVNGQAVLFYNRKKLPERTPKSPRNGKQKSSTNGNHVDLLNGLRALGLTATDQQVESAIGELFPAGIDGIDEGELMREVFLHLRQQE
jgi:predicted DNA-binding transcriptional regulator AlpA